ncbi:MAG: alpha-glucosidase, partial [Acidobacteriaceae bacterium]|nr:alpha-glucosidase [Acidobacteriaceae bacterium]
MPIRSLAVAATVLFAGFFPLVHAPEAKASAKPAHSASILVLDRITGSKTLPNGIELRSGDAVMEITALRDDVLRVRVGPQGTLPEDASWAVLPQARTASVPVAPASDGAAAGFETKALRVKVARATMALTITDLEGKIVQQDVAGRPIEYHGHAFRVYKQSPLEEHYFGLGDKTGPLDRRNMAFAMWNTDMFGFQESTDPIYKTIPFFLTMREGRTAGVFLDNTWRSSFDFNKEQRDAYSFGAADGPLDYYVMYGPDPKQVLGEYAWLTGTTPLPPLWSLGYQQSRYSYYPESEVRNLAKKLRQDRIPSDVIWLDIDYQKENRPFTVDTEKFPTFAQMIADLKKEDFHTVVITDLHIAKLPNAGYAPYDTGVAEDRFVKMPDGSTYVGVVWPGPSVFPEFTQASARAWWGDLYKE